MNPSFKEWHSVSAKDAASRLSSDMENGLLSNEALNRLRVYGPNELEDGRKDTLTKRLLRQFKSPLIYILFLAGIVTYFLGEYVDTGVIFAALLVNVVIGVIQEGRASRAFEKLNDSQEKFATVIRDGERVTIPARLLVPGDICFLGAGDVVPADIRIIEAKELLVNESALTGEAVAVLKQSQELPENTPLTDRLNMAWMGTLIASGAGFGVVVETGNNTEIGDIAENLIGVEETETPLQKNITKLANFLLIAVILFLVLIFALGVWRGESATEMAILSIALAVSVIPEGLPAAVTVVLAIGMERILKKRGLVRNLLAAETLGSTTCILTDKTGTLTQAKMELSFIATLQDSREISPSLIKDESALTGDLLKTMEVAITTSDAFLEKDERGRTVSRGRPLEKAVLDAGLLFGLDQRDLLFTHKRLDYIPFKSSSRFEVSLNENKKYGNKIISLSGSPETLLHLSSYVLFNGKPEQLDDARKKYFTELLNSKAREGMRFIAVAYKETDTEKLPRNRDAEHGVSREVLDEIVFAGLLAFSDPVRRDVPASIEKAQAAGARVIMLTGDHPETAVYIAKEAGIKGAENGAILGVEVEEMGDEELLKTLKERSVFARMVPTAKLRIANLLKEQGEIVAMTGDGVNDAPALKHADIGVAVGSGTAVAQEASDLILLDNSFSIIVSAIEEGRRIIDNLKKVVSHLLSTNFSEVFVITGAIALGLPLPLLATQILWVNIIGGGLLNFAFAFEPKEDGILNRNPHSGELKTVFTKSIKQLIFLVGVVTGLIALSLYLVLVSMGLPIEKIRTIMFVALSIDIMFIAFSLKNLHRPVWKTNLFSNRFLLLSLAISFALLMLTLTVPFLKKVFEIVPLSVLDLLILIGIGASNLITIEIAKYFIMYRRRIG